MDLRRRYKHFNKYLEIWKKMEKNINFDENKNLKSNKKQILWSYKT